MSVDPICPQPRRALGQLRGAGRLLPTPVAQAVVRLAAGRAHAAAGAAAGPAAQDPKVELNLA